MRMERKEEESQSFEVTVNKGKEVDSSPSPAAKNRKEDDYWHSIKLIRQAQFMTGGDKLGLEGLPYVQTYLPSKEDTRAANKVNRNMGDVGTTSNPPDPGAMVDANSPVVSVSISPMVEQASTGWLRIYVVVITLIYSVYWRLVSLEQRQQTLLESLVSLLGILWKVLASLEVSFRTIGVWVATLIVCLQVQTLGGGFPTYPEIITILPPVFLIPNCTILGSKGNPLLGSRGTIRRRLDRYVANNSWSLRSRRPW
ncbi:uncharacterized protein [Arachis hypogaea]|uniref:uncharacterized protein isoform X2 n=1 Tax=Arachis hypogaea TaxID=3818 RepID=UPI003B21C07D